MDDFKTLLSVESITDRKVVTLPKDASIEAGATRMMEEDAGSLLVVDGDKTLGIVTESDVVRRGVAKKIDLSVTGLSEIMTPDPLTIPADESIFEARKMMDASKVKHLIVMKDGAVFGVLTPQAVLGSK